ncbi:MAG: HAD family hydrolase [Nanoarchaeota archaeon]|nr:HAD family hydrolase [Nanoarchaeota archaeon]
MIKMVDIQVVSFDWSGVLSDDRRPVYEANMRVLEKYGKKRMPFEIWLERTTLTPVEFMKNHGINETADEIYRMYTKYFNEAISEGITPTPYPNSKNVLNYLTQRGYILIVLSSHPEQNLLRELEEYGLRDFFRDVFGGTRNKVDGITQVAGKFKVQPPQILHIGDTIHDIAAAKEAGAKSAGICTGYHTKERLEEADPDYLFDSLDEIVGVL